MKTLKFNEIRYQNIMSVGQQPVHVKLDAHHKSLVTGVNGAGKSTMLEALCFCLFGKPFRDLKKGQLVNSVNKKALLVEVWMQYDKDKFYIKRGIKPNVFEIERNGVKLDESASVKDFQEYFEQLIGMSYPSFKQMVVLGTAGYTPFMGLRTPERRKLVEDLLEVSVLAEMDKLNKAGTREITQNINVIDLKVSHLQDQIKTQEQFAEQQKKKGEADVQRYQTMYDDFVTEAKGLKSEVLEMQEALTSIVLDGDPAELLAKLVQDMSSLSTKQSSYARVLKLHEDGGTCPTCMQQIGSDESIKGKVQAAHDKCGAAQEPLIEKRKELESIRDSFNVQRDKLRSLNQDIVSKKEALQTTVAKAKRVKAAIDELSNDIIDNTDQIIKLTTELTEQVKAKSNLVMEKYVNGIITDMLKDSGIKSSIIEKYIPYFNSRIGHYLKIMEADYSFTLDSEFNETIKSRGREDFSYTSFSQGEKARIDIAMLFTWRDVAAKVSNVSISALFLDEVFDGALDTASHKQINQIMKDMKGTNIFIISHRDHDPQDYGQHLKMVKKGRFTVLE
ncbi:SbcC-like subunit of palindrome specific endonuclease [Serratia phage 92A1]|nr:SbcC-like subunit of palindrome specific endonuclease [Serratia phage 92A1]